MLRVIYKRALHDDPSGPLYFARIDHYEHCVTQQNHSEPHGLEWIVDSF